MHPAVASFATSAIKKTLQWISLDLAVQLAPQWSASWNIWLVSRRWKSRDLPNNNTKFMDNERFRWLVEAQDRGMQDPVIVFLHGGGYCFGLYPPFLNMLMVLYNKLGNSSRYSILIVDYPTDQRFPVLLKELCEIYTELSRTCQNIVLMGDSAGGHLSLSLLRHAQHPFDDVPTITIGEELSSLVLLSPWVSLWPENDGNSSYERFKDLDYLTVDALKDMTRRTFDIDETLDSFNPMKWDTMVLPRTFVSYGAMESMRDDISRFVERYDLREVFVEEINGVHDSACFWPETIMEQVARFLDTQESSS